MSAPIARPITETPNELTANIDIATPIEIVRLLRSADAQIFGGYGGHIGMNDPETHDKLAKLADIAAGILRKSDGCVVLSGAGTSGRLAMFAARTFNRIFATPVNPEPFRYTIAGTNLALIAAQEGAEDNPNQGIADLTAATEGASEVFYVGITCGLSAPYIAGQLQHMLDGKIKGHSVLLGFNPIEMARTNSIEGWEGTFKDVALRAADAPNCDILNPIVGPEPITGSTRMKSGSATKILLETLFHAARAVSDDIEDDEGQRQMALNYVVRVLFADYEAAIREAYLPTEALAELIDAGGDALNAGGRIFYLGTTDPERITGGCDNHDPDHDHDEHDNFAVLHADAGIIGLIDASECPPTYGASFEDVRGYINGGWPAMLPGQKDLSDQGPQYHVAIDDFKRDKLSTLTRNDLVVFLGNFQGRDDLVEEVHGKGARSAAVVLPEADSPPATGIIVEIAPPITTISSGEEDGEPELFDGPPQLSIKLVLNALTTGAHILTGKVFGNRMVDLRISNNKLFYRTVGIISDLTGADEEIARHALLGSVYSTDELSKDQLDAPVSQHIEASKSVHRVVPVALLMATRKYTWKQAVDALEKDPVVRNSIRPNA